MRQLLIGDCHFGTGSNSVTWLENQLRFFNTQIVEVLETKDIDRVVFLGDLTDIRYSVNQQVGIELKNLIRKLSDQFNNIQFFFLAGNHDYYSPLEEFHTYNSYELIFGEEFVKCHPNVRFINNEPYFENGDLYLPWYYTENFQNFSDIFYQIDDPIKNIFCHDDLSKWDYSRQVMLKDTKVWSGHIHFINAQPNKNLYNLGAAFAFNFNDVNSKRYVYILDDNNVVEKIENITTPKFKRYFNESIFDLGEEDFKNAYVQLCIFNTNINKAKYIERIKEIKSKYAEYNIRIQIIDNSQGETLELSYFNANIDKYIEENVPEYLTNKYTIIKDKINIKEIKDE